jgi:hypothetical protein
MNPYPSDIEQQMQRLFKSLNEENRRRYAAIEATKLGWVEYRALLNSSMNYPHPQPLSLRRREPEVLFLSFWERARVRGNLTVHT